MNNINPLRAGLLILSLLVVAGLILFRFLPGNYKVAVTDSATLTETGISPSEFASEIRKEDKKRQIVDLRSEADFSSAHLENAINLPFEDLGSKKNLKALRKKKVYVYSSAEALSHQAAFLLQMNGIDAKAVNSDFTNISAVLSGKAKGPAAGMHSDEKIRYDYRNHFKAFKEEEAQPIEVTLIKPKPGGC